MFERFKEKWENREYDPVWSRETLTSDSYVTVALCWPPGVFGLGVSYEHYDLYKSLIVDIGPVSLVLDIERVD